MSLNSRGENASVGPSVKPTNAGDLTDLLKRVSDGTLTVQEAEKNVLQWAAENSIAEGTVREGFQLAFDRLRRSVQVDELLKISSDFVSQIAEGMPSSRRLHENVTQSMNSVAQSFQSMGFVTKSAGVEATLSSLRDLSKDEESKINHNHVVGSKWFDVSFENKSQFLRNRITALQFSESQFDSSVFEENLMSLSRISNSSLLKSEMRNCRFSRCTISDASLVESQLVGNKVQKSQFLQVLCDATQIVNCHFSNVDLRDCELKKSRFEGITFESCSFYDCTFEGLSLIGKEGFVLNGYRCTGLHLVGPLTMEQFCQALKKASST